MTLKARDTSICLWLSVSLAAAALSAGAAPDGTARKALVIGRGYPLREPNGNPAHPQSAKDNFLKYVGNPANDPAKGWTCDLSWDLMVKLGMDPDQTTFEELFAHIGKHKLGYRIVMQNGAGGANAWFWGAAVDNGLMAFAPHGDNTPRRVDALPGLQPCVAVGGGRREAENTYGPSLEFFEAVPNLFSLGEDTAQSWANQMLAAKFAKILDRHPEYNIWDARQHLRQTASHWNKGWTERNGFGRVDLNARPGRLLPGPPLEFRATVARNARQVVFNWRNFPMTDFAATVIAFADGRVIYDGRGTNFTWDADRDGEVTFTYWSKNLEGQRSRLEAFQARTVAGLSKKGIPALLVLGGPAGREADASVLASRCRQMATHWLCDVAHRPGNTNYDHIKTFPWGNIAAMLPDWEAMVGFAISNRYRIVLAPGHLPDEPNPARHAALWERAVAANVAVVTPHSATRVQRRPVLRSSSDESPGTQADPKSPASGVQATNRGSSPVFASTNTNAAKRLTFAWTLTPCPIPPRLGAAITVGFGVNTNMHTTGPGLEFFDATIPGATMGPGAVAAQEASANLAAAALAAKLARVLQANPSYNLWDARQHLRQSASHYAEGWSENGGYGRPPAEPQVIRKLDLAPPLGIQAVKSEDGRTVTFSWLNFEQTGFASTGIEKADGTLVYQGTGTSFTWRSDETGDVTFRIFTLGITGGRSRDESYAVIKVVGLQDAQ